MKKATLILISVPILLVLLSSTLTQTAPAAQPAEIAHHVTSSLVTTPAMDRSPQRTGALFINDPNPDTPASRLTVVGGTEEQRETADWAVAHFVDAGLELPELVIAIHASDEACEGFDGAFRGREIPARLDVCNPHRLIILHELAHAWDHHTLTDALRQDFMDLRGLTAWNDAGTPWKERGIEDLAEVVVWGLRQFSSSAFFDEQPEKRMAFALVTGINLSGVRSQIESTPATDAHHDRSEDDADWDTLH